MSIYHLSVFPLSRKKGRSPINLIADLTGQTVTTVFNTTYTPQPHKQCDKYFVLLPDEMPDAFLDPYQLWWTVELSDIRANARLARGIDIAFPIEFTSELNESLIRTFCQENFVSQGMAAAVFLFLDAVYPRALILLTMRPWENNQFGSKYRSSYQVNENGERIPELNPDGSIKTDAKGKTVWMRDIQPTNDWSSKDTLIRWRKSWESLCNQYLPDDHKVSCEAKDRPFVHVGKLAGK